MFKKTIILLVLVFGSASLLCTRDFSALAPDSPMRPLSQGEQKIVKASGEFGFSLFKEIQKTQKDENIFISPLSVSMALGMTLNGAANETARAMQNTLEFGGLSDEEINQSYQSLIRLLADLDPKVRFQIANSIWYRLGFTVEQPFVDVNKTFFNAEVNALDFNSPEAVATINSWVDSNTNGKIKTILDQIDPMAVMFLINAIYFKGTWTYEFDKKLTEDEPFYIGDTTQVTCKMMKQSNDFLYFQNEEFQAIDLPYGDGAFRMTVFLPAPGNSVDALIAQLNAQNWAEWMGQFSKQKGTLYLPKFKLKYEKVLNQVLSALGMGIAFDGGRADFTKINKNGELYISQVRHKSFVDVYEEGTEAAAVTIVEMRATSVGGESPGFFMRVDRPFLFAIREQNSQTILFMGKIMDPAL
ncbi:MAG: serpin family protein [Calditrichaeota bacterium]|nr:serpin family protein [Calditrichota bacterium]